MNKPKLKVLVVDDEPPVRQLLRMFDWEACGAEIVAEAANGHEAIAMIERFHPDVLLTDIVMPQLDGLGLLEHVKAAHEDMAVVFLTCHNDLEYARKALKQGVLDYMLKVTLTQEELAGAMERAGAYLEQRRLLKAGKSLSRKQQQRREFMEMLNAEDDMTEKYIRTLLPPAFTELPLTWVRFSGYCLNHHDLLVESVMRNHLENLSVYSCEWFFIGKLEAVLFVRHTIETSPIPLQIRQLADGLRYSLDAALTGERADANVFVIMGDPVVSYSQFRHSFRASLGWGPHFFYRINGGLLQGEAPQPNSLPKSKYAEWKGRLSSLLPDKEVRRDGLEGFFKHEIETVQPDPVQLSQLVFTVVSDMYPELPPGQLQPLVQPLTVRHLLSSLLGLLDALQEQRRYRVEVRMVLQYIDLHLKEPVTIAQAADMVHLSPDYFSKLFQEDVGESFKDYITRKRLEKACQLLQETTLKVYEIAEEVGIANYRYFSGLFRKKLGVLPTEYKRG